MRSPLPIDDNNHGITDKYMTDAQEKNRKERVEAKRYRIPLIISIILGIMTVVSLCLQIWNG